jgi:hypothetical protein
MRREPSFSLAGLRQQQCDWSQSFRMMSAEPRSIGQDFFDRLQTAPLLEEYT